MEIIRPNECVEVKLNTSFEVHPGTLCVIPGKFIEAHGGALRVVAGKPSTRLGIPYYRPVVGYGGQTVNTLRLWAAATPDYFDFQEFSKGDFVGALAERLAADTVTRVLYPNGSTSQRQGLDRPVRARHDLSPISVRERAECLRSQRRRFARRRTI